MIKQIQKTINYYECPVCGSLYPNKELAFECEQFGKEYNKWKNKCKNWHWFIFKFRNCSEIYQYFICKVKDRSNEDNTCTSKEIELHKWNTNDYFVFPEVEIIDILSITEMFEKYGKIPDPYYRKYETNRLYGSIDIIPLEIAKEIDYVYDLYKKKMIQEMSELSKEEIILKLLIKDNKYFDNFSFEEYVKNHSK